MTARTTPTPTPNEKMSASEYDDTKAVGSIDDAVDAELIEIDPAEEKRVVRKIDMNVVPMAVILYLVW